MVTNKKKSAFYIKITTIFLVIFSLVFVGVKVYPVQADGFLNNGSVSYGDYTVGDFTYGGTQVFCMVHDNGTQATGVKHDDPSPYDNDKVLRVLYYGWGGPKSIFSKSERSLGIVATSLALSTVYGNDPPGSDAPDAYRTLIAKADDSDSVPNYKFKFSDHSLSVHFDTDQNKQISQTATLVGDSRNHVTVSLPRGVHLENLDHSTNGVGSETIYGGDRFYLWADANYTGNVNTGDVSGYVHEYQPMRIHFYGYDPKSGRPYQELGYNKPFKDPPVEKGFSASFTAQTHHIYAQYIDTYDNSVMWQDDDGTSATGSHYSVSSSTHGFTGNGTRGANGCTYKETGASTVTGTTGDTDVYVKFYYDRYRNNKRIFQNKYKNDQVFYDHTDQIKVGDNYSFPIPHQINDSGDLYDLYQDGVLQSSDYHYTGTQPDTDISKTFYYILQRPVDVKYKDNRTGNEIGADKKYTLHQGNAWDEHPAGETENGYTARYVGREDNNYQVNVYDGVASGGLRGTINTNPLNIDYYYDIPLMKIGVRDLQIYTASQNQGLPVKVQLDKSYNYDTSIGDMGSKKINVSLYQGSTRIATNQYAARDVPSAISWTIPSSFLSHQSNGSDLPYMVSQNGTCFSF